MTTVSEPRLTQSPVLEYLETLFSRCEDDRSGAVANYIPELELANPDWFGISVATTDG